MCSIISLFISLRLLIFFLIFNIFKCARVELVDLYLWFYCRVSEVVTNDLLTLLWRITRNVLIRQNFGWLMVSVRLTQPQKTKPGLSNPLRITYNNSTRASNGPQVTHSYIEVKTTRLILDNSNSICSSVIKVHLFNLTSILFFHNIGLTVLEWVLMYSNFCNTPQIGHMTEIKYQPL